MLLQICKGQIPAGSKPSQRACRPTLVSSPLPTCKASIRPASWSASPQNPVTANGSIKGGRLLRDTSANEQLGLTAPNGAAQAARGVGFSPAVLQCLDRAWQNAAVDCQSAPMPHHILLACLEHDGCAPVRTSLAEQGISLVDLHAVLHAMSTQCSTAAPPVMPPSTPFLQHCLGKERASKLPASTLHLLSACLRIAADKGLSTVELPLLFTALSTCGQRDRDFNTYTMGLGMLEFALCHLLTLDKAAQVWHALPWVSQHPCLAPLPSDGQVSHKADGAGTEGTPLAAVSTAPYDQRGNLAVRELQLYAEQGLHVPGSVLGALWDTAVSNSSTQLTSWEQGRAVLWAFCFTPRAVKRNLFEQEVLDVGALNKQYRKSRKQYNKAVSAIPSVRAMDLMQQALRAWYRPSVIKLELGKGCEDNDEHFYVDFCWGRETSSWEDVLLLLRAVREIEPLYKWWLAGLPGRKARFSLIEALLHSVTRKAGVRERLVAEAEQGQASVHQLLEAYSLLPKRPESPEYKAQLIEAIMGHEDWPEWERAAAAIHLCGFSTGWYPQLPPGMSQMVPCKVWYSMMGKLQQHFAQPLCKQHPGTPTQAGKLLAWMDRSSEDRVDSMLPACGPPAEAGKLMAWADLSRDTAMGSLLDATEFLVAMDAVASKGAASVEDMSTQDAAASKDAASVEGASTKEGGSPAKVRWSASVLHPLLRRDMVQCLLHHLQQAARGRPGSSSDYLMLHYAMCDMEELGVVDARSAAALVQALQEAVHNQAWGQLQEDQKHDMDHMLSKWSARAGPLLFQDGAARAGSSSSSSSGGLEQVVHAAGAGAAAAAEAAGPGCFTMGGGGLAQEQLSAVHVYLVRQHMQAAAKQLVADTTALAECEQSDLTIRQAPFNLHVHAGRVLGAKVAPLQALTELCVSVDPRGVNSLEDLAACMTAAAWLALECDPAPHNGPPSLPPVLQVWLRRAERALARILWRGGEPNATALLYQDGDWADVVPGVAARRHIVQCVTVLVCLRGAGQVELAVAPDELLRAALFMAWCPGDHSKQCLHQLLWGLAVGAPGHEGWTDLGYWGGYRILVELLAPQGSLEQVQLAATACQLQQRASSAAGSSSSGSGSSNSASLHVLASAATCALLYSMDDPRQQGVTTDGAFHVPHEHLLLLAALLLQLREKVPASDGGATHDMSSSMQSALKLLLQQLEHHASEDVRHHSS